MGTWGPAIKSNDTSSDIYEEFMALYNEGKTPSEVALKLIQENSEQVNCPDETNNFWFAIGLALWETKSLDQRTLDKLNSIIGSGSDLVIWRNLGAEESEIKKRRLALDKFLKKISVERPKAKARKKKRIKKPIFEKGTCLTFKLSNGNFGGAIVLEADITTGYGYNLIACTRLNNTTKPTPEDLENSELLIVNFGEYDMKEALIWLFPDSFVKDYSNIIEPVGKINVKKDYDSDSSGLFASYSGNWSFLISDIENQLKHETLNPQPPSKKIKPLLG